MARGALTGEASTGIRLAAVLLAALGCFPVANWLTAGRATPWFARTFVGWMVLGGVLLAVLLAAARLLPRSTERAWDGIARATLRVPRAWFVAGTALFAFVAAASIFAVVFARQPHDVDEAAQLWHAKMLASGRLALAADPHREFFAMDDMIDQGRWYSHFPMGGPAFLAIGVIARAAWLLNPALLALSVVGVYAFARRAYDEQVARASALLLATSPFALFMGASYMNHVPTLFLACTALAQLAIWHDARAAAEVTIRNRAAAALGLSLGLAFTVRPLDAIVLAFVCGLMQLATLRREPERWTLLMYQAAGALLPAIILFWVNTRTTGAAFRLGYDVLYGTAHGFGLHADPYGVAHTPARALIFLSKYLLQLSVVLFEWPLPAIGVLAAGLLVLRRPSGWDRLLLGWFAAQAVAYSLYWAEGMFRGPRFLFTAIPAAIVLVARAPFLVAAASSGTWRRTVPFVLPACVLFTWLATPFPTSLAGRMRMYRRTGARFQVDAGFLARQAGLQHALVFVNEDARSRALHDLWSLGIGRGDALRLMDSAPTCGVRQAIDEERARVAGEAAGRLARLVERATSVDPAAPPPAACIDDARRDASGWSSYMPFFAANSVDADGRVGGEVVYALDLGDHNEALRLRFADRRWYRATTRAVAGRVIVSVTPYDIPPP